MNITLLALFFKIIASRDNAARVTEIPVITAFFPGYFDKRFSSVCLNNDTIHAANFTLGH